MGPARPVNMAWSSISEELIGHGGESGHDRLDASDHGGCLLDSNWMLGVTRPVSSTARPVGASRAQALCDRRVRSIQAARLVTLVREQILLSDRYDRTNEIQSETRGIHREVMVERPDAVRVWLGRTSASGHPECGYFMSQRLYSLGAPIYTCWLAPRRLSWTFDILVSTLS
jgi:hypothetical protein